MTGHTKAPTHAMSFKRRLLKWFRREGRDLPWRRTREPYEVLVSEFMLQQTQVSRVVDYYHKFLDRFPTVYALADAKPHQVRDVWAGLGYYRRAANLHALARRVVQDHDGRLPDNVDDLKQLPGVGTYTAGAVSTFAYRKRVPAVDTNVDRVVRRAFHPRLGDGADAQRRIRATAAALIPLDRDAAWEFNQGIMELGALICVARSPKCAQCSVRTACSTGRRTEHR